MEKKTLAILLAIYDPREDWLVELLQSLNAQTYPHLRLYVRDDASPSYPLDRLEALLKKHITAFPYVLNRNETNLGSNETFAALVKDCNEPLIAFCDQDDVWLPQKLEKTVDLFLNSPLNPILVCTNVSIIDGEGNQIASRMEEHRKRHTFLRGEGLAPTLINRNFAMGCTMVTRRETVLGFLPFPREAVHDHYLAFRAANAGALDFLDEPQLKYRVYGGNQTGVMTGVRTKQDYYDRRIGVFDGRVQCFCRVASFAELESAAAWCAARKRNFYREKGGFGGLYRHRRFNPVTTWFELIGLRLPTPLFRFAIRLIQKGFL